MAQISSAEVVSRRSILADQHSDGLIILPAKWEEKRMEQPGWIQDATFSYFTLLNETPGAVLVIDATSQKNILFAPVSPQSFGIPIESLNLLNRPDLVERSGVDAVISMDRFMAYIQSRLDDGVARIYLDAPRRMPPRVVPDEMLVVSNFHQLWYQSLKDAFPDAEFDSIAYTIMQMRWTKSDAEIAILERNAQISAEALSSGMRAIQAGLTQRQAEGAVISACLDGGAEGPSFWPWVMTGPNAHLPELVRSFYDYENLNREYRDGELVRVDIGCMSGGYGGDVGRTVPVSGKFTDEQALIWDLLVKGYLAGLDTMKAGATFESVREASRNAILEDEHASAELKEAMVSDSGVNWHIHGVGIDSGESPAEEVFRAGSVIAYEPMFTRIDHAYYLEDMILITASGSRILTTRLPYTAAEMELFLEDHE